MTTNTPVFTEFLQTCGQRIEQGLQHHLPPEDQEPKQLHKAIHYAVLGKGKRIRPLLVYATGLSFNATPESLDAPATAVEFIHAYSLIHDDLPAMDDDDMRRGKPSCHKMFGEATAILAGDTLQSLAFELLSQPNASYSPSQQLMMVQTLASACAIHGMTGGQQFDLESKEKTVSAADIEKINALKTGALIKASVKLGAIAANCTDSQVNALDHFATLMGLVFQMQDDIFDNDTNADSDAIKKQLESLFEAALTTLDNIADNLRYLKELSHFIMQRTF